MKRPNLILSRVCKYAAVLLGAYAVVSALSIMDLVPMHEAADALRMWRMIFFFALSLAVASSAFLGVARARCELASPQRWQRIVESVLFWLLFLTSIILTLTNTHEYTGIGVLLFIVWVAWGVFALVAQASEFATGKFLQKGK